VPDTVVTFIGAGNMASALIGGLLATGWRAGQIRASDPLSDNRDRQANRGIRCFADNAEAIAGADVVILAVKPQVLETVCRDIADSVQSMQPLVISIAAGVETGSVCDWLGDDTALVRCMPNTPALVQLGASVLFATTAVSTAQHALAERLLTPVGTVAWVDDESLLHAVTAVSGSGPAYFYLFMEALRDAGQALGLPIELSTHLATRTALGAATLAATPGGELAELRRQVTSPGGTTERAIASFEHDDLHRVVTGAVNACAQRSRELAEQLAKGEKRQ
jgi:pyrroline-5-carboxylate reductase